MELSELLKIITTENRKRKKAPLGKTKLLKLAYIIELYYKRLTGKRLTDTEWIYYLYGPWTSIYDEIISKYPFIQEKSQFSNNKEITAILIDDDLRYSAPSDLDLSIVLNKVFTKYLSASLNEILEYIYFDTEPMLHAEKRREKLFFDVVQDESYFKVKELHLTPTIKRKIEKKLAAKVQRLHG